MMKPILLLALAMLVSQLSPAQSNYFSGKITYKTQCYDSLGNKMDLSQLGRDSINHYYIADGNYKTLNPDGTLVQLYNCADNQYYFNNQGQIQVMSASYKYPQSGSAKQLKGKEKILKRKCKRLMITSEAETTIKCFSKKIKVDRQPYENHNFGNWNLYLDASEGALSLRSETTYHTNGMSITMKAIKIEEMELSAEDFNIATYQ